VCRVENLVHNEPTFVARYAMKEAVSPTYNVECDVEMIMTG
jgi:hypothetical protein